MKPRLMERKRHKSLAEFTLDILRQSRFSKQNVKGSIRTFKMRYEGDEFTISSNVVNSVLIECQK